MTRARAFSLIELIVAIGLIAVLIGFLIPMAHRSRQHAARTKCASNLRQLGAAFAAYAVENRGFVPRYSAGYFDTEGPIWVSAVLAHLRSPKNWQWPDLSKVEVLQCPSHPTEGIPTAYVLNCFAVESAPAWTGAPSTSAGKIRNASRVPWLVETPDLFGTKSAAPGLFDDIFFEPFHVARSPDHLPLGTTPRINDARHVSRTANVLYFDGHVDVIQEGGFRVELFDDGIRSR
jgi:prepilin-type processing-associated H-X9-DG protein/prepilin-type N-terminal cleavage/methylation domain-containing protein